MRVLAVQIWDHPGVGNLEVNFAAEDGRAARLVVIAGENGCGKTALLETIFNALAPSQLVTHSPRKLAPGRYRVLVEIDTPNTFQGFNGAISPNVSADVSARWPLFKGIVVEMNGEAVRNGQPWHQFYRMSDNTATTTNYESSSIFGGSFNCFIAKQMFRLMFPE